MTLQVLTCKSQSHVVRSTISGLPKLESALSNSSVMKIRPNPNPTTPPPTAHLDITEVNSLDLIRLFRKRTQKLYCCFIFMDLCDKYTVQVCDVHFILYNRCVHAWYYIMTLTLQITMARMHLCAHIRFPLGIASRRLCFADRQGYWSILDC